MLSSKRAKLRCTSGRLTSSRGAGASAAPRAVARSRGASRRMGPFGGGGGSRRLRWEAPLPVQAAAGSAAAMQQAGGLVEAEHQVEVLDRLAAGALDQVVEGAGDDQGAPIDGGGDVDE